jgi:protoheme ferro-lyase
VSAASGEPEVIASLRRYLSNAPRIGRPDDTAQRLHLADILAAYDTLAQQRDAAVRERDGHEQNALFAVQTVRDLEARLAACEQKNERVMSIARRLALRSGFAAQALSELEAEGIDRAAVAATDDFGPNDGHARTVRRSAGQEDKV